MLRQFVLSLVFSTLLVLSAVGGIEDLELWWTTQSPAHLSCAAAAQHPRARWIALTDCEPALDEILYQADETKLVDRIWVPLRPSESRGAPMIVVEILDRRSTLAMTEALRDQDQLPDALRILSEALRAPNGLLRTGSSLDQDKRFHLGARSGQLAPGFVILQNDLTPMDVVSGRLTLAAMGATGLVFLTLLSVRPGKRRSPRRR